MARKAKVEGEFYPTPPEATRAVLGLLPRGSVFDPCAGDGAILAVAKAEGLFTAGIEIDPARSSYAMGRGLNVTCDDAFAVTWPLYDLIVMNPPFSLAQAFVEKALRTAKGNNGTVACLTRLAWLGSSGRAEFFAHYGVPDAHVMWPRPKLASDPSEYAWLIFGPGRGGRISRLKIREPKGRAA